ncbi:unnamed protein product [Calypogeia fissa]
MLLQSPPSRHSLRRKGSRKMLEEQEPTVCPTDIPPTATRETVMAVVDKLQSENNEEVKRAVIELRLLSKWDIESRVLIGEARGIPLLVSLITSRDSKIQENAVTTLLNLSIFPANRKDIMDTRGTLESITQVLISGQTLESKENCAALVSSLLILEEYRDVIGNDSALLDALRNLLNTGRVQGKKDALRAIFHLALWADNRSRLANADILPILMAMMASPRAGLIEDTLSVLAKIAMCREGMEELNDGGTISLIVEYLQHGSRLAKENASALLLALCQTGGQVVEAEVRKHHESVVSSLCTLRAVGSPRAKAKASDLMKVVMVSESFSLARSE